MISADKLRIYDRKFYLLKAPSGISGFKNYQNIEYRIMKGCKARNYSNEIIEEYSPGKYSKFRLENGRLPEFQATVSEKEALEWLDNNPWNSVFVLE